MTQHHSTHSAPSEHQERLPVDYGITRTNDKRQGVWGWVVGFSRDTRRVGTRYFYDHHYVDGMQGSLAAARVYRDIVIVQYPPLTSAELRQRPLKTNTSGVPGVHRDCHSTGYWVATTELRGSKNLVKKFSIKRFGEEEAKQMAIAERGRQLQHVDYVKVKYPSFFCSASGTSRPEFLACSASPEPVRPTIE